MILQVGLTAPDPVWIQVLDQEKITYCSVQELNSDLIPVVIFTKPHGFPSEQINGYLSQGGVGIADLSDQIDSRFEDRIVRLDFESLERESLNERSIDKHFSYLNYSIVEHVAQTKKSNVRKKITASIRSAFWKRNLPYVHLWYYPDGHESVFSFRFDLDEHEPSDFKILLQLIKQYEEVISCFVCMKTYEHLEPEMKLLFETKAEIASHAYVHHVYQTYPQNRFNLQTAENLLRKRTKHVNGFSAPHGQWHPTLEQALEEGGYSYSSEFCLDYDNFPMFPILNNRMSKVLHIATHAVCEGVFLQKYPYSEKMFDDYYSKAIEELTAENLPVLFFGHPDNRIGRYPNILHNIMKRVSQKQKIWNTNFKNFASWWLKRHNQVFTLEYENGTLRFPQRAESIYSWEIELPAKGRAFVNSDQLVQGVRLSSLDFKIKAEINSEIRETPVHHSTLKRMKLTFKNWLDWENKTPIRDLKISNLNTFVKYIMRSAHDLFHKKSQAAYS